MRPWFSPDDCYFQQPTPLWTTDPVGQGRNPKLDIDNISGFGPENIRVATPEIGVPYTVAVDHFKEAAGRIARIRLFCGVTANARVDLQSRPLRGSSIAFCQENDFWVVATITFSAPEQCSIDLIDEYRTTADACAEF